jgi:peptidoglycan/LPS O-acetylase OafA/YrhL
MEGPVDSILSWKYFEPLSKLSFCAYLVHLDVICYHCGFLKTNPYFSHFELVKMQVQQFYGC